MDDFRYLPLGDRHVKVFRSESGLFFWSREFALPNSSQYLARRTRRWEDFLTKAYWPKVEAQRCFGASHESLRRAAQETVPEGAISSTEQTISGRALLALLCAQSSANNSRSTEAKEALKLLTEFVEGEVVLQGACSVACEVHRGIVSTAALQQLVAWAGCPCPRLRFLGNLLINQPQASSCSFLEAAAAAGLSYSTCTNFANLLLSKVAAIWETLPKDPLQAQVAAQKGKKTFLRLDPSLKTAFSEVAAAGKQHLELAKRLGGRFLAEVKQLPTQSRLSEVEAAAAMSQMSSFACSLSLPRLSLAMDCSRLSGEKTMVTFALFLEKSAHGWLPVQAVRDFTPQIIHNLQTVSLASNQRWIFGLQNFFQDFSAEFWKDAEAKSGTKNGRAEDGRAENDEAGEPQDGRAFQKSNVAASKRKQPAAAAIPARLSSYDLLVCLDNALAQVGLPFQSFLSQPQICNQAF